MQERVPLAVLTPGEKEFHRGEIIPLKPFNFFSTKIPSPVATSISDPPDLIVEAVNSKAAGRRFQTRPKPINTPFSKRLSSPDAGLNNELTVVLP